MPGDYFFLNYGVQDGNVMQGLFRVNKITYQLEVYDGTQWVVANAEGDATATPLTTAQRLAYAPASGALIWDVEEQMLYVGDGETLGGEPFGSSAISMTTAERTAIVPRAGQMIWDTDIGALFIGDGETEGGINTSTNLVRGATNGIIIEDGIAKADIGSTYEVLIGSSGDKIVDTENLTGALSLGQTVDVSCAPYITSDGSIAYTEENNFLAGFTCSMVDGTTVGFYDNGDNAFPKYAEDSNGNPLKYLFIADISGTGTVTPNGQTAIALSDTPQRIAMVITAKNTGYFSATEAVTAIVNNWRQYEVNNLSDGAIAVLGSTVSDPNPDSLFRSSSVYSVRNRYLIKQDMVCPWIPTINMPDNSAGLTIGAGLSYKIKYTKTGTYSVSVDTIPTDAYGWDSHIQMFVKDTATVQFQAPLILMDALTPNSGHNLSVKFRNGNALVYVDDTNAGTMVYLATGTTTTVGSLPYALSQTPSSEDATFTNFIVFSPELNGTVCSAGVMSNVAYSASLIGNGNENTIIGGTIGLASGKYLAVQDINLNDITITSGTLNIGNNVSVTGTTTSGVVATDYVVLDSGCLLDFSSQTNNIPITASTITAVNGARVIPYGETESKAIVAGTGNAVDKYGKCGYLVSEASGTTSGTLYDALIGGGTPYSNVIFNQSLDGQDIVFPSFSVSTNRDVKILGNGRDKTTLVSDGFTLGSGCVFTASDLTLSVSHVYNCVFEASNCTITNAIAVGINLGITRIHKLKNCLLTGCTAVDRLFGSTEPAEIVGCTISGNTFSDSTPLGWFYRSNNKFENCIFDTAGLFPADTNRTNVSIVGCTFSNMKNNVPALQFRGSNTATAKVSIKDSVFSNNIVLTALSTVSFAGTNAINATIKDAADTSAIEFSDGATVTSIIPDGSTIGTGIIDLKGQTASSLASFFGSTRTGDGGAPVLENIKITGATYTDSNATINKGWNKPCKFINCEITGNTVANYMLCNLGYSGSGYNTGYATLENPILFDQCYIHANSCINNELLRIRQPNFIIPIKFVDCTTDMCVKLWTETTNSDAIIILGGTNRYIGSGIEGFVVFRSSSATADMTKAKVYILKDSVLDFRNATGTLAIDGTVSVGTLSGSTWTTTAEDTAKIITTGGTTVTVCGGTTGTYINLDGTTDLPIIS